MPRNIPSSHLRTPSAAKRPSDFNQRFLKYMIEMLALTFGVDFDTLNTAIYEQAVNTGTNTILTRKEHEDLCALSCLVQKLDSELRRDDIDGILYFDYTTFSLHIRFPICATMEDLDDIAIDLISWYGSSKRPSLWKNTVPGLWDSVWMRLPTFLVPEKFARFEHVMRCCKTMIMLVSPNETVFDILYTAFEDRGKFCGLKSQRFMSGFTDVEWRYSKVKEMTTIWRALTNRKFKRNGEEYVAV